MDRGSPSTHAKAGSASNSGEPSQSPQAPRKQKAEPQTMKQEFVHIKQKVDALLDHLEKFMKEPDHFHEMMKAKATREEPDKKNPKKPKSGKETEAKEDSAAAANYP